MPRHVGDIAALWVIKVGIRAFPDIGAHCLIESLTLLSLEQMFWVLGLYISESRILFTPQSLRRSGEVSWHRSFDYSLLKFHKKKLGSRGYLGIVPMAYDENIVLVPPVRGLVEVSRGVELRGVVVTILSSQFWNTWVSPTSKISFMQLLVR